MSVLYIISDILYIIVYKLGNYRQKIVQENLSRCFPKKTNKEIMIISNKFYHHFFDLIVESIKSISADRQFFKKRIHFKNIDIFHKYYSKNQSTVLAVAHYGNWEWGILGISICAKQNMTGVYKKLNNNIFNQIMMKIRRKFGANLLEMNNLLRYILNKKENPEIIGLLADQSPSKNKINYHAKFFNQKTPVYLGPEKISIKMDYPVLFCNMHKIKRGHYEIDIEELCINPRTTKEGEITSIYLKKVEESIKRKPEFWLWTHRRWKYKK